MVKLFELDTVVLKFKGSIASFFEGITSNRSDAPHNALLTKQGKIVCCFEQWLKNDQELFVVIPRSAVDRVQEHLKTFLMLSDVELEQTEVKAYFALDGAPQLEAVLKTIDKKKGCVVLAATSLPANVTDEEFTRFRVDHDIPLQDVDFRDEMLLNVFEQDYVSYDKGCFVGQEIIARVHYKSRPPKRLVVKHKADVAAEEVKNMTSLVPDSQGKERGFIFESTKSV